MRALSLAKFTFACTPGSLLRFFSMRVAQAAHVMPWMGNSMYWRWDSDMAGKYTPAGYMSSAQKPVSYAPIQRLLSASKLPNAAAGTGGLNSTPATRHSRGRPNKKETTRNNTTLLGRLC
jgi:hypothetical protein